MSLPLSVKLDAYRGDTFTQEFRLLQGTTPLDLTGCTVAAWARNGSNPIVLDVTVGPDPGVIAIGADAGLLPVGDFHYDVEVTDAGGMVTTWVRGLLTVTDDVTNRVVP